MNLNSGPAKQTRNVAQLAEIQQLLSIHRSGHKPALICLVKSPLRLDGMLFSSDTQVLGVLGEVLRKFAIQTEICSTVESAVEIVSHHRLDAVVVDWEDADNPARIVRAARRSSPNSTSTIVAAVDTGLETHALLVGANFMIHKPATLERASRCVRAAYGTMLQNRRRAARVPVDLAAEARVAELGTIEARISDLSIGGMALQCKQPLQVDREVWAHFSLPGSQHVMHVIGRVVNADGRGRAGVRFSFVPEQDLGLLETWLASELAKLEKVEMPTYSMPSNDN